MMLLFTMSEPVWSIPVMQPLCGAEAFLPWVFVAKWFWIGVRGSIKWCQSVEPLASDGQWQCGWRLRVAHSWVREVMWLASEMLRLDVEEWWPGTLFYGKMIILLHIRSGNILCTNLEASEHHLYTFSSQQWLAEDDEGSINGCSG